MRNIVISIIFLLTICNISWAQDTIIMKTGVKIICNIEKVDSINIHYSTKIIKGSKLESFVPMEGVREYKYDSRSEFGCYWFNVGVGAGSVHRGFDSNSTENEICPSFGINFSSQVKKGLISIRFIYNEEMNFLRISPKPSVSDFGVLYGRMAKVSFGFVSISGGISYVFGEQLGAYKGISNYTFNYETKTYSTIGIPFESQIFWTPRPNIGFGIYGFANINSERSFYGGLFCIQLGKLR